MKKLVVLLFFIVFMLSGCLNPFKKYADDYIDVVWTSTENSDLDVKVYVLDTGDDNRRPYLVELLHENVKYEFKGFIHDKLRIMKVDEYGYDNPEKGRNEIITHSSYLKDNKYKSEVSSDKIFDGYYVGKTVELGKTSYDSKANATPNMFSGVEYSSDSYNLFAKMTYKSGVGIDFFVSYGTMEIAGEEIQIGLKFLSSDKFIIFKKENIKDILLSGTCTNEWLDISLTILENNIDDIETMKLTGKFNSKEFSND